MWSLLKVKSSVIGCNCWNEWVNVAESCVAYCPNHCLTSPGDMPSLDVRYYYGDFSGAVVFFSIISSIVQVSIIFIPRPTKLVRGYWRCLGCASGVSLSVFRFRSRTRNLWMDFFILDTHIPQGCRCAFSTWRQSLKVFSLTFKTNVCR